MLEQYLWGKNIQTIDYATIFLSKFLKMSFTDRYSPLSIIFKLLNVKGFGIGYIKKMAAVVV
jgi:hypothetical protein